MSRWKGIDLPNVTFPQKRFPFQQVRVIDAARDVEHADGVMRLDFLHDLVGIDMSIGMASDRADVAGRNGITKKAVSAEEEKPSSGWGGAQACIVV